MKKLSLLLILLAGMFGCKNQEIEFPDYDYTTGYFPYQYPIRTLVLGDYIYDNTNDNDHKFLISAAMGGVYKNDQERIFKIQVDNSLVNQAKFASTNQPMYALPERYYKLSSTDQLIIPKGEFNGNIEVQLTDAFFDDTLATKLAYVLPVRITEVSNLDSLLVGKSILAKPDPRIVSNWDVTPKNFTMFAVKYVNPFHGNYFHRGKSTLTDAAGKVLESSMYHQQYVEKDEVWTLNTKAKNKVTVEGVVRATAVTGKLSMLLTFTGNDFVIQSAPGSAFNITGTGKFVDDADEWGNKKRDALYLNYQFTQGANKYTATDTLVVRDRGVILELFQPVITP
ncbi:DUF5627 domain-containing protein [Dyadobacter psychrotolerans]|uniref:DUF1735 domain-containing protein n=1 Tax=Dyadobacter psychrotolerans TaxID=2541721 RepID=A0A4R5DEB4_9BACT|nr:DUF5627 domain-containing protein [Dyadobacter psychrotolerans]TDE12129.1 DUF1735 domain-containing protein [Dyadobacter psychrotolerans]